MGVELGDFRPVAGVAKKDLEGEIVIAPPSAMSDRWSRRLPDPVTCGASGWMQIRARARQRMVELPMVISDHADWDDLTATMKETGAGEIWVTHGREEALVHYAGTMGMKARALSLLGYEEDEAE
jgi:putative mRNA 3-end processing factor